MNGIDCFFEGLKLVRQPGLRQYVIIPIVINTIVLSLVMIYSFSQYEAWLELIKGVLPDWLSFISSLIGFLAAIVIFALSVYGFSIIANIISSPFNAILSQKVEEKLTGFIINSEVNLFIVLARSLTREISKLAYFLPRLLGLIVLSLIPGLNALAPVAWILFGAWMMTVQYADYAADNNEIKFSDLRHRLENNVIQSLLFGIIVYFVIAIPLLNLFVIPVAVAGGTVFWVERLKQESSLEDK
ncbi:MAG: CysZ protein [Candidatus Azotimanducaceae bacterium]|jgi:CysZ protein